MNTYAVTQQIVDRIRQELDSTTTTPLIVFLEGGHFDPREGATEHALNTLQVATEVTSQCVQLFQRQVRIVLGILVDDLGLDCGDQCSLDGSVDEELSSQISSELPKEIEQILKTSPLVKRERVLISSERNAKNRGIKSVKEILKSATNPRLVHNDMTVHFEEDLSTHIPLASIRGEFWSAKCPVVMGQHYHDVFQKNEQRFDPSHPQILIDFSEIYDRNKVNNGSKVSLQLLHSDSLASRKIVNICFKDDACEKYSWDEFSRLGATARPS